LAPLIHDNSDKVRLAFVNLLNTIKNIKSFKFWEIVPIEHLLARLREESSPERCEEECGSTHSQQPNKIIVGLVNLLQDTYFPLQKEVNQWTLRCVALIQTDPRLC
jgi:condensin-2 complex subunit G2